VSSASSSLSRSGVALKKVMPGGRVIENKHWTDIGARLTPGYLQEQC
jgi:hypothetical protein